MKASSMVSVNSTSHIGRDVFRSHVFRSHILSRHVLRGRVRCPPRAPSASLARARRAHGVGIWLLCALLGSSPACSSSRGQSASADDLDEPGVARYRLPLRHNPVDRGGAFRCYGHCQAETSPTGYLQCLAGCPGFEVTQGRRCAADEVPPIAACFTVRQIPKQSEPSPGWVVLAVIANVALIVTLASVCASSASQCGYGYYYPPGPPPY